MGANQKEEGAEPIEEGTQSKSCLDFHVRVGSWELNDSTVMAEIKPGI